MSKRRETMCADSTRRHAYQTRDASVWMNNGDAQIAHGRTRNPLTKVRGTVHATARIDTCERHARCARTTHADFNALRADTVEGRLLHEG
jgi:hypothetical protein